MINRTSVYHNFRSIFIPYFKYVGRGRFVPCDSEIQKSGAAICRYVIAEVKSTRHGGSFITKTFMIVHRFMSDAEYECLMAGASLINGTIHGNHGQATTSVGFCFFTKNPDEAIHWLSGCCDPEWCVTMEFPDGYLKESEATYRDPDNDDLFAPIGSDRHKTIKRKEYCCMRYDNKVANVMCATQKYRKYAEIRKVLKELGMI